MKKCNLILASCLLWFLALPTSASPFPDQANISVSGVSEIQVKPDMVTIQFQAIAIENNSDGAKSIVDKQVNNVLTQLSANGFDQALLTRADLQLRTEYEFIGQKRVSIGVKATRNLSYQLDDVSKLNTFLQLLVKSEISSIGQIHYALKEPAKWQLKARNLAVKDSVAKAKNLAKSYQMSLGNVYSINYQGNNSQPVLMRAMSNEDSVPSYQNNKITISEQVDAVFLLNAKK